MRLVFIALSAALLSAALFLFLTPGDFEIVPIGDERSAASGEFVLSVPEPQTPASAVPPSPPERKNFISDIEPQPRLANPPEVVKGIYITAWSAGSEKTVSRVLGLIKRTELNAVVIDIKDFSGHVSYRTGIPEVAAYGAEAELRILRPNALIKRLHDEGIYVIARQTIFQDPILARAKPEWAMKDASTRSTSSGQTADLWADNKGLHWMDPAAKPVWDYNVAIAKDAFARGFDEVNFDYIRFASDGDLSVIEYPFWQKVRTGADSTRAGAETRNEVIKNFFKYLRENLPNDKISADLFGLSTINAGDLGIGQVIEDAYEYFDYVCPMVYPSHYAKTFLRYQNPAEYPYEVIKYSMDGAVGRLLAAGEKTFSEEIATTTVDGAGNVSTTTITVQKTVTVPKFKAKLRPWLQDFDLGAVYDAEKVRAQIQAVHDSLLATSTNFVSAPGDGPANRYAGWLLWDPANRYTETALQLE